MPANNPLSPWWARAVALTMCLGFGVLILMTTLAYKNVPPIPSTVVDRSGLVLFTSDDIMEGQQVFLKHGLMDNGTIWGHGAYMGLDFSATTLHIMASGTADLVAFKRFSDIYEGLSENRKAAVRGETAALMKENTYDSKTGTLTLGLGARTTQLKLFSYWHDYFSKPSMNGGLFPETITDCEAIRKLAAFFTWTAWVSTATRPGTNHSYTNNFPYEPFAGNYPTSTAILSSAFSVIALLGFLAVALLAFGKFDYLGWKRRENVAPALPEAPTSESQRATLKYMAFAALLFLFQVFCGAAIAHYRAEPGNFYGLNIAAIFPSNLLRIWHLQSAIFWIATSYVGGALFVSQMLGGKEPVWQKPATDALFLAFGVVIAGSLLGQWAGLLDWLPQSWFWFGNQGWEYLEIGRFWQFLLAVGLLFWFGLLVRAVRPALQNPDKKLLAKFFLAAALAIPVFYIPAFFFTSHTHMTIVDTWRFWIIHLWVEGFFEFFVTVIVAVIFIQIGLVQRNTALRIIYLDAILYFMGGVIGTGHHWYWSGQTEVNMAISAVFSAIEVVPLTLLTLDAWDFVKVTGATESSAYRYKWTFYFLMAVGAWNFVGAGLLGFLINMPIISYYEVGTMLTANHGHAAMMGVFGMLGVAIMLFVLQSCTSAKTWEKLEKPVRLSFWGLNGGLLLMVLLSLLPGGIMQILDVIENGYWHARELAYTATPTARFFEWTRMPPDLIFMFLGALPLAYALVRGYIGMLLEKKR